MELKRLFVLAVCALAPFLSSPCEASRAYVGVQVGPEIVSDSEADLETALGFGVYAGYRIDRMLGIEASLTTADHDPDGRGADGLEITSIIVGPRINAQAGSARVYADVGLGLYFLDFESRVGDDTESSGGISMGAGIEVPLQRSMSLGMDLKYHVLFDDDDLDSDLVTLMVRLGFDL
ncbi:MAG TPA: porin family protein [Deltaproteobacteria bacterium]|nr:porin family protein [Deltaproteobacteria bacterium]HOM29019.1 porin family protein [Deltaproteobacteria bacterium]HPP81732.1 porin family protein [Deltaproteobacteria bacterium]